MNYKTKTMNYLRFGSSKGLLLLLLLLAAYSSGYAQVGVNTESPQATLHVNGDLIVADAKPIYRNASNVVIDNNGKLGVGSSSPIQVLFLQSAQRYIFSKAETTTLNNGVNVVIPWLYDPQAEIQNETNDFVTNNIMDFNSTNNTFTFRNEGLYEITGYLNYIPGSVATPIATGAVRSGQYGAALNISIQYYNKATSKWVDLAAARALWELSGTNYGATVVVPPAVKLFKAGDRIRMVCKRPDSSFGIAHNAPGIIIPTGMGFSKGLKVSGL